MPISIAQLNILAQHFNFDINEARLLIGLPHCNSRITTSSKTTTAKTKRSPNGYNLFCSDCKLQIEVYLKTTLGVSKLPRGALMSELSKRWKLLPQSTRDQWNSKA